MRRHDKQMANKLDIETAIREASVCYLGLCDGEVPYVVPLSFGYEPGRIFFHSAGQGRKLDVIRRNPRVSFAFAVDVAPVPGDVSCAWTMRYRSVVGEGHAVIVTEAKEKTHALDLIMAQYGGGAGGYDPRRLSAITVVRVDIETMTGKHSG
ncbi:MAG: pyridoxamine 5'-phosphate oxidase family protein [Desulfobacterales bacterium]|jgi:nitroimidazol reductase NimA-like FMN-containing flavoprotein (pyridoxamine 5'-phosphate oxidase superfamily)|nr:pyridoxamine 5'-phosphate oxidase family protein [Desulfobacteraceae bacterium]MDD3992237.1 pyridoxamine 5'-phosphate oxidase family protein [Desulfobacteraceae bacterium]MDY0312824.1 pyridoxamine 5'-phosphate oxidase family protein [Desulfobacterales bacterium]